MISLIKPFSNRCAVYGRIRICYVSALIYYDFSMPCLFVCVCVIYWNNPKSICLVLKWSWRQMSGTFNMIHFKWIPEIFCSLSSVLKLLHTVTCRNVLCSTIHSCQQCTVALYFVLTGHDIADRCQSNCDFEAQLPGSNIPNNEPSCLIVNILFYYLSETLQLLFTFCTFAFSFKFPHMCCALHCETNPHSGWCCTA